MIKRTDGRFDALEAADRHYDLDRKDTIENHTTIRNGMPIDLHRCPWCTKQLWYAVGKPATDNGWVPTNQPIAHLPGCRHKRGVQS